MLEEENILEKSGRIELVLVPHCRDMQVFFSDLKIASDTIGFPQALPQAI